MPDLIVARPNVQRVVERIRTNEAVPAAQEDDPPSTMLEGSAHILESIGPVTEHHDGLALPTQRVTIVANATAHLAIEAGLGWYGQLAWRPEP